MTSEGIVNDVERSLASDTRIDHTMIRVSAGDTDVIVLDGQVDTYNEKILAEEIAGRVRGVKDVVNNVSVVPPIAKSDEEITEDVRKNLELDAWVDDTRVSVETIDGVVFLRGTANSRVEKQEAENDARWVAGVIDVVNHLVVKPEMKIADAEVARDVRAALLKNTRLDLTEVNVDVTDGVVTLTGEVPNFTQKRIAEYVAFSVPGVVDVVNELYVHGARRPAA
ncbi:MAG: BON domain-containing protein [Actinobacteria bacterium]|nr:BON domain-containing protein [Actinomycetota bacterium]